MIKAYLDNYEYLIIEISKAYYNGKVSKFFLIDENSFTPFDSIDYLFEDDKVIVYRLLLPLDFNLNLGKEYYVSDNYGYKSLIIYRYITKSERFNHETFTEEKLGSFYKKTSTNFSLWAPISNEVILVLDGKHYLMKKEKSVFKIEVAGDLKNKEYSFLVKNNGKYEEVMDSYALSYNYYQQKSVVIDKNDIVSNHELINPKKSKTIYEVSVRDFTSFKKIQHKGTFLAFAASENISYLDSLGVEYVQLMPVNYFAGDFPQSKDFYNWGYNPLHFNLPHPSYVVNLESPISIINEFKYLVNKLHQVGIKVSIDVVFNHVYDKEKNNLNKIVPYYFYLMNDNYQYSDGSYCGNDIDSQKLMVRRYFKDILDLWVSIYDVDGFRFDLMGILDIESINYFKEEIRKKKENVFFYGEGWNMPSFLNEEKRASILNNKKLDDVSFFNDYYRESLKYNHFSENLFKGNYLINNTNIFSSPSKSINYLQCHDDHTYFDLKKYISLVDENQIMKEQFFKTLLILISNGYAFIGSGQEFFNSKQGVRNSYNSPDEINHFDWDRASQFEKEIKKISSLIHIRSIYNLFSEEFNYSNENGLIRLENKSLLIIINTSEHYHNLDSYDKIIFCSSLNNLLNKNELVIIKKE